MIDPRAYSSEKIIPPSPLPYVSRNALKRLEGVAPMSDTCRYCSSPVVLTSNATLYRRSYGKWPYIYLCTCCKAYVGLHPGTDLPLGTLANAHLREKRQKSKLVFNELMWLTQASRTKMYLFLAWEMNLHPSQCHFASFEATDCDRAERICAHYLLHFTDLI